MARNSWKFKKRDARVVKAQNIEVEYLAPDTVGEILFAMSRLETLRGRATLSASDGNGDAPLPDPALMKRYGGVVLKPARAWRSYRDFCRYFAVKTLVDYFRPEAEKGMRELAEAARGLAAQPPYESWINIGGQIVPKAALDELKRDIAAGALDSWEAVHARYDGLWKAYPGQKARYALLVLEKLFGLDAKKLSAEALRDIVAGSAATFASIRDTAFASRKKDYEDPFRKMTYENDAEMIAVLGRFDDNSFLKDLRKQTDEYLLLVEKLTKA
jgi:hypothetical protein